MTNGITEVSARTLAVRGEDMLPPDEVAAMVRLHELGWGAKRLSKEFGCARNTVRRYLRAGGVVPFTKTERKTAFDGLDEWLRERFFRHGGNADVVRQELASEHGIVIGLRSVELRVQRWRRELRAQKRATVRFETRPGHQLQIDFGEVRVWIGDERLRVHLFVATLGYSRRMHVQPSIRERQVDWFEGMEGAFLRFGGVPAEVLFDNARALVEHHDAATREVRFNARLHAFARYWGFSPRACAPYRARTKGKDERGVGYVKRNAVAGRRFVSWGAFVAHLEQWNREIADVRVHGTTGELPLVRFAGEAAALRPLGGRAPFGQLRDLIRKVRPDCAIDLDTNSYSVPWRLVGETVQVVVLAGRVIVRHAGEVVADHAVCDGRRQRIIDRTHLAGLVGTGMFRVTAPPPTPPPALLRPLAEYEALVGGGW
ncbi:IS21 family transposase [Novosphingobium sp. AAP93]|uniref:IS21 family transposase n=1 Tax=Novosphingobium sp. AAP93 TaxID=1523427 RepID=UPI0006B9BBB7|nr:IS21 family transposase [Novosphingobium sp. AAP93]KPF77745.1 transposase [Novosphingobium sp. AAP93]